MLSLQYRLAGGLLISLIFLLGLQWILVSGAIRYLLEDYIHDELNREAEAVLAAASFDVDGDFQIDTQRLQSGYGQPFFGHYFQVTHARGSYRSRSLWDTSLEQAILPAGVSQYAYESGPAGQQLLVNRHGYRKQDQALTIIVAEDISGLQHDVARFRWQYGLVSIVVMVLLILLQIWVVRRSLRPVEAARRQLQDLEHGKINALSVQVPREIMPLILEINRLLQAMQLRVQRSRKALGNLAHGLKTPLSVLQQLLSNQQYITDDRLRADLLNHLGKIRQLTDRELKRARLAGGDMYVKSYRLADELQGLVHTLNAVYRDKALTINQDLDPQIQVNIDREDLLELLGNLLDNACKWARSTIGIQVRKTPQILEILISDDGPGCASEDYQRLAQRGLRLDEQTDGHGLGLGIVADIVESYRGTLTFSFSKELGGLQVEVILPN